MSDSDSGDLLLVAAGDAVAFGRLLDRWRRPVYAFFERTREPSAAVDAAADVFGRLFDEAADYSPTVPVPHFVYRLAVKRLEKDAAAEIPHIPAQRLSESRAAQTALIRAGAASLPAFERTVFLLSRVAQLPNVQIAVILGHDEADVRRGYASATETLVKALAPMLPRKPQANPDPGLVAAIEALYSPELAGDPPADLDQRVLGRLTEAPRRGGRRSPPLVPILVGGGVAILGGLFFLRSGPKPQPIPASVPSPQASAPASPGAAAPRPTAGLEIPGVSLTSNLPPITEEERARVIQLFDFGLLRSVDALGSLDAFFPEDLRLRGYAGPFLPKPTAVPVRPPEEENARENRILDWRGYPDAEKRRLETLDADFRKLPEEERVILLKRWDVVSFFSAEENAGMRRLASRFTELDEKKLDKLKAEIRALAALPADKRAEKWMAMPFTKGLTGQEIEVGRKLLAAAP